MLDNTSGLIELLAFRNEDGVSRTTAFYYGTNGMFAIVDDPVNYPGFLLAPDKMSEISVQELANAVNRLTRDCKAPGWTFQRINWISYQPDKAALSQRVKIMSTAAVGRIDNSYFVMAPN